MISTISETFKMKPVKEFTCSDGKKFENGYDAERHESFIIMERIFGGVSTHEGQTRRNKKFFFSRNMALECGVYRITVRDEDEMEALDFFFVGIYEKLGFPEKFPITVNIEIYQSDVDGVVKEHAMWRIFKMGDGK